jgi:CRISPR-associated endoribonuclease Cas6
MRFKITFSRTGKQRMLPMDYQYYLSAWIYKVIEKADREFSEFLHSEGYSAGHRRFKLFNYSPLDFGKPVLWKEKSLFEIINDRLSLKVSFLMSDAAEKFIIGLFNNQEAYIGDQFNGLELSVSQIERLPDPEISETMLYRAVSPVVVSRLSEGDHYAQYLSPEEPGYCDLLRNHFVTKYGIVPHVEPLPEQFEFNFRLMSDPRSKLVTMKPYTPQQSKLRGYIYDFELTAPAEIHRLLLASGVEKGSMGFGWCEEMRKSRTTE